MANVKNINKLNKRKSSFRSRFNDHLKELHYQEECEKCRAEEELEKKCKAGKKSEIEFSSDEDFDAICDCNAFRNPQPKRKCKLKPPKEPKPSDACCTLMKVIPKAACYVPIGHRESYSVRVLDKRCKDETPENNNIPVELQIAFRPRICLELVAVHRCCLGRFTIQLYTEACPALVMEFTAYAEEGVCSRMQIRKIEENVWIKCKLIRRFDDVERNTPYFEHCFEALSHRSGPGIVSVPARYLCSTKDKNIPFTISLNPLNIIKGKRIAIGKICDNLGILKTLAKLKAKYGCFKYDIAVSDCGLDAKI